MRQLPEICCKNSLFMVYIITEYLVDVETIAYKICNFYKGVKSNGIG